MKEALFYKKLKNKKVRCQLCSHRCLIPEGKRGICSVRENQDGKLNCLVYGKAIAANPDPIEKKPLFHFQPGTKSFSIATAGCNLKCAHCQNWQISQITKKTGEVIGENLPPKEIVKKAKQTGCASIAYTYTEPTIFFEYARDTSLLAKKQNLANVFVTNGYQTPEVIREMAKFVDAANVDLKAFSESFYQKVCGAKLAPVLESIKNIYKVGIHLEITTLLIPGKNDSSRQITQIARFISQINKNIPWHISRFHPNYQMLNTFPTPLETLDKAYQIGKRQGLKFVYLGNVPQDKGENTYCPKCGSLAIKRAFYQTEILKVDKKGRCQKCAESLNVKMK